jgi:hypothetical protein
MKKLILLLLFTFNVFAGNISGVIKTQGEIPKGTLYVFAKKFDSSSRMPLAVKKITNPSFPLKFSLSEKDSMMKGIPFVGPFKVIARISPNGGVMDKSGVEASTQSEVKMGAKDIEILLKK